MLARHGQSTLNFENRINGDPAVPVALTEKGREEARLLGRQVAIQEIKINPFALSAAVRGVSVKEPASPEVFVSFQELFVDLQAESLIRRGPILREIRLDRPYALLDRFELHVRGVDGGPSGRQARVERNDVHQGTEAQFAQCKAFSDRELRR